MTRPGRLTLLVWVLGLGAAGLMAWVVGGIVWDGAPFLWSALTDRGGSPAALGMGPDFGALVFNTVYMVAMALAVSVPLGLAAGIARVEYGPGRWGQALESVAATLAAMPSVVMGMALFWLLVDVAHWPLSRLTGVAALTALNAPWVAASTMLVLRAVPDRLREASLALGATPLTTVRRVVLPSVAPALVSGLGIGGARLLGESAALLYTGGLNALSSVGLNLWAPGGTLAVHLFFLGTEGTRPDAVQAAAATGVVLLLLLLGLLGLGQAIARMVARRAGIR